jgi:hypothetical protein
MTEQAGVRPTSTKVTPGDDDLVRITGARVPSGEPIVEQEQSKRPPRARSAGGAGGYRGQGNRSSSSRGDRFNPRRGRSDRNRER